MTLISTITVISALSPCLCQLFARTEAYAIHRTCKTYSTDLVDKTGMIEAAMAEAKGMLSRAAAEIVYPTSHEDDNTVHTIFRDVTDANRTDIAARFTTAVNSIPWSVTNHNALALDGLTIVCGGDNFFPDVGAGINAWTDFTDFYTVYSINHHFNNNARLCGSDGIAMTISVAPLSPTTPTKGEIILLCDEALVKGISPDSTGSQAGVAAISALPGTAGLYPGKLMDDLAYTACLSFTLVHELFHATQIILFSRGPDEAYGWANICELSLTEAMMNPDTYAYFALANFLPPDFFVFGGLLGSVSQYNTPGDNPFRYP